MHVLETSQFPPSKKETSENLCRPNLAYMDPYLVNASVFVLGRSVVVPCGPDGLDLMSSRTRYKYMVFLF